MLCTYVARENVMNLLEFMYEMNCIEIFIKQGEMTLSPIIKLEVLLMETIMHLYST